jgi:hypothetical protein
MQKCQRKNGFLAYGHGLFWGLECWSIVILTQVSDFLVSDFAELSY